MKLSYELAKKLKDAGFSLKEQLSVAEIMAKDYEREMYQPLPTLSELIEACGEINLYKRRDADCEGNKVDTFTYEATCIEHCFIASTPEEAVANLWLALNTKQL